MFGRATPDAVRLPYSDFVKPGVRLPRVDEPVPRRPTPRALIAAFAERGIRFFSGPTPTGIYHEASTDLVADKELFGSSRRARWFGC